MAIKHKTLFSKMFSVFFFFVRPSSLFLASFRFPCSALMSRLYGGWTLFVIVKVGGQKIFTSLHFAIGSGSIYVMNVVRNCVNWIRSNSTSNLNLSLNWVAFNCRWSLLDELTHLATRNANKVNMTFDIRHSTDDDHARNSNIILITTFTIEEWWMGREKGLIKHLFQWNIQQWNGKYSNFIKSILVSRSRMKKKNGHDWMYNVLLQVMMAQQ